MNNFKLGLQALALASVVSATSSNAFGVTCHGALRNWPPLLGTVDSVVFSCAQTSGTFSAQKNTDSSKVSGAFLQVTNQQFSAAFTNGIDINGVTTCQAVDIAPVDGKRAKNIQSCQAAVKWNANIQGA